MTLKEKLDLKFNHFFTTRDYIKAQLIAKEILNLIDENKFPVYSSYKNNETPYIKLFENYFETFNFTNNPNKQALKLVHFNILNHL